MFRWAWDWVDDYQRDNRGRRIGRKIGGGQVKGRGTESFGVGGVKVD
jgi:hypothetical protein